MTNRFTIKNITIGSGRPKICVPIVGRNDFEIKRQVDNIKYSKAEIVEWRVDYYEELMNVESILSMLKWINQELQQYPLIFTIRTANEGGNAGISASEYQKLIENVINSRLIDIIDIELFIGEQIIEELIGYAHQESIKVILSNHEFGHTPKLEELVKRFLTMDKLNADLLKIAVMPKGNKDVITLISSAEEMQSQTSKPLVAIAMGKEGLLTRIGGEFFGSCISFASVESASAPGQIQADELDTVLSIIHKNIDSKLYKDNIILIGFMGTGKSAVSLELSRLTGMQVMEMDSKIEEEQKSKITELFSQYGEEYFRDIESKLLKEILNNQNQIISCGGGIILRDENIETMKNNGIVVWLTASPDTIYHRVKHSQSRPILNNNMSSDYIETLLTKRLDRYKLAADITIDTDSKSIHEIGLEIVAKLEKMNK